MVIDVVSLLHANNLLVFFLVLGLGYLVGNLSWRGFEVGATSGVLLAGLFFGHFGFQVPHAVQEIGFVLFIYSVGLQAGPRFFSVFAQDGMKYLALSVVIVASAMGAALLLGAMLELGPGMIAGMVAGALTSTPTLAASEAGIRDGLAHALSAEQVDALLGDLTASYAITYLFGLAGLIACIRLLPTVLRIDLPAEAAKLARENRTGFSTDDGEEQDLEENRTLRVRAFEVANPKVIGRPLRDLQFVRTTGCVIQQVRRGDDLFLPDAQTMLEKGDLISVAGPLSKLEGLPDFIGPGTFDAQLLETPIDTVAVVVSKAGAVGKRISELHIPAVYGCFITRVIRTQIELPVSLDFQLEKGDVLVITGLKNRLERLVNAFGYVERRFVQTDLLTFCFGIVGGMLLGQISIRVGDVGVGLGTAGGLLFAGLIIGFLRSMHPTFGRVPPAARWILRELGLLFFMAGIGVKAGVGIVDALLTVGLPLFVSGVVITLTPVIVGLLFGRFVLGIQPALLLGAITGAMTSTPSLNVITQVAKSPIPALGYAGTYTFANVFLALAGTALIYL
ncbi:aspartate:alanine exchanger family transporter [Desulfonatronum thioautotrophicum]|uniref:aspartate:alanine exchanger family transporter n=1 Tax=Desulfonatronum thioautotrophicum TaxID=617001 RepID=UPI0005EAEEC9|nr:TrkA C-terminal domain-containing protein [Desulfonatronum thioautotrophicum]